MCSPIELVDDDRTECFLTMLGAHLLDLSNASMTAQADISG